MSVKLSDLFKSFVGGQEHERKKLSLLFLCFFIVIGSYTLVKELKDSVFINVVGLEYLPWVKLLSMVVLIPSVFFYSQLVDVLRRSQLLSFYAVLYGIGGLLFAYFLGHKTIGLSNTDSSPSRLFGWIFYFFIEGYAPFVVSVLWAFVNSITSPEAVKKNYVVLTAGAKLGGALMAGFAWWILSLNVAGKGLFSDIATHQFLLVLPSASLLFVPFIIARMMATVPEKYLHGYEAAYQMEKKRVDEVQKAPQGYFKGLVSGLYLLVRYPYVLGIFGMIFFWEIVNVIFNYLRLGIGQASTESVAGFSVFLYQQAFFTHLVGFVFVLMGTRVLIGWLGERKSLIAIPLLTGISIACYLAVQSMFAATLTYIMIRAINYSFAYPLRESLYIPTSKAMKFKSKLWIDGFGSKLSKGVGSYYNIFIQGIAASAMFSVNIVFFGIIIVLWSLMAHLLGRRFEHAVKNNEVIGSE